MYFKCPECTAELTAGLVGGVSQFGAYVTAQAHCNKRQILGCFTLADFCWLGPRSFHTRLSAECRKNIARDDVRCSHAAVLLPFVSFRVISIGHMKIANSHYFL